MLGYMVEDDEQYGSEELSRVDEADINDPTSASTDGTTSMSINASIDRNTCCRLTPIEIPESSSYPQYSADSTHKSTDDEAQSENLDQNLEKKPDDDQHTSEKDLKTSPEASIDRHHPPDIDRYPPDYIDRYPPDYIDRYPPDYIDRYPPDYIDRYPPDDIDRHLGLDELSGYIFELEPIEERMHESETSHLAISKHQRPPIWTEEAAGFHKRVKRIHDRVKIVVPCVVFEAESPIPPDRSMQFNSYIEVLDDHQHVEASQRGLRFKDEVDKGSEEATSIDTGYH
ncbi:hypothetical protein YC2023_098398 [Brassica napus]